MTMLNFIYTIYKTDVTHKDVFMSIVSDYNSIDTKLTTYDDEKLIMKYLDIKQLKLWKKALKIYVKPTYIERTGMASLLLEECRQMVNKSELSRPKKLLVFSAFYENEISVMNTPLLTIEEYAKEKLTSLNTRLHILAKFINLLDLIDEEIAMFKKGKRHNTRIISITVDGTKGMDDRKVWQLHKKGVNSYTLISSTLLTFKEAIKNIFKECDVSKINYSDHYRYCILHSDETSVIKEERK